MAAANCCCCGHYRDDSHCLYRCPLMLPAHPGSPYSIRSHKVCSSIHACSNTSTVVAWCTQAEACTQQRAPSNPRWYHLRPLRPPPGRRCATRHWLRKAHISTKSALRWLRCYRSAVTNRAQRPAVGGTASRPSSAARLRLPRRPHGHHHNLGPLLPARETCRLPSGLSACSQAVGRSCGLRASEHRQPSHLPLPHAPPWQSRREKGRGRDLTIPYQETSARTVFPRFRLSGRGRGARGPERKAGAREA